tara:strand:- start:773 stop:1033 length:261 start_codon:yes stop_codon:yes gene_type:complete
MIKGRDDLIRSGLLVPTMQDWRVRLVFEDGNTRVVRVSPATIDEADAVERALTHAKILDRSVLKSIEAERVAKSGEVAPYGMIQKG